MDIHGITTDNGQRHGGLMIAQDAREDTAASGRTAESIETTIATIALATLRESGYADTDILTLQGTPEGDRELERAALRETGIHIRADRVRQRMWQLVSN